jgi:hypothetical protein
MSKQDRQGARNIVELMGRYNFGKTFAEIFGLAKDAQNAADRAQNAADEAQKAVGKLDHDAIFNLLTNNGELQGLYRHEGKLFINAEFVKILNLIADHVVSKDEYGTSAEVWGGVFRLYQDKHTLVEMTTEYDGYPVMRMTMLTDGKATTRLEMYPEGIQVIDVSGPAEMGASVKFGLTLDVDGDPAITCKDTSGDIVTKKIVWEQKDDGTFYLVGQ